MKETGIVICSYNMPEWTDALVEHIHRTVKREYDLCVFDNGSDLVEPSQYTTNSVSENIQMVPGFMRGLDCIGKDYKYYWLITTSCRFKEDDARDPLDELLKVMEVDPKAFAIQPSLDILNFGAWKGWLTSREPYKPRRIWGLEQTCVLFDAEKFESIGRWRETLSFGWGVSGETFWKARKNGWHIYTHDGYVMEKVTAVGYEMNRMEMTYDERARIADQQVKDVFVPIYGDEFYERFRYQYLEDSNNGEY